MQANDIKQSIDSIEECADEAKRASTSAPSDLRQSVEQLHQQARQAQQACSTGSGGGSQQQGGNASQLREPVMQHEQAAARAMQACRNAGSVDPQLKEAIQRAHQQASSLKMQVQMG